MRPLIALSSLVLAAAPLSGCVHYHHRDYCERRPVAAYYPAPRYYDQRCEAPRYNYGPRYGRGYGDRRW